MKKNVNKEKEKLLKVENKTNFSDISKKLKEQEKLEETGRKYAEANLRSLKRRSDFNQNTFFD